MTRGSFATWNKVPTKARLLPSRWNLEKGAPSPLLVSFQRDSFQVLEKDVSEWQNWQDVLKNVVHESIREGIYNYKFSKVNAVKNRWWGF